MCRSSSFGEQTRCSINLTKASIMMLNGVHLQLAVSNVKLTFKKKFIEENCSDIVYLLSR